MSDEMALVPVEQKEVVFYEDMVTAVLVQDKSPQGTIYVPLRPLVDRLGLSWPGQFERLQRDEVLSEVAKGVRVTRTPEQGGDQDMLCLPLRFLPGWLFGIQASRVKDPEIREKIIRYRRECYDVLWEAFQEGRLTAYPGLDELLQNNSEAVQAYKLLQAMVKLARNQIFIEAQVGAHSTQLANHEQRLEEIESTLGDESRHVTPDQASQISQAVKTVAMKLSKQSGRNEYGGVYGELYRKFGITSYKQLPAAKFDEAMGWLNEWRESIEGEVPF